MRTELRLRGFDEFLAELDALVPELTADARARQDDVSQAAAAEIVSAYPVITGELRDSVEVVREASHSSARVYTRIAVTSPHAGFYEFGTARTAPHPTFTPIVRRAREAFRDDMIAGVEARGLEVHDRG